MIAKNQSGQGLYLFEWNTSTNLPITGDAANITGKYSLDGATPGTAFATVNPTEVGNGVYWQPFAQAETNGNAFAYRWASTTPNAAIAPAIGCTTGATLSAIALGSDGALPTVGATGNAHQFTLSTAGRVDVGNWLGNVVTASATNHAPSVNMAYLNDVTVTAQVPVTFSSGAVAAGTSTTSFTSTSAGLTAQSTGYAGMALLFQGGLNQGEKRTIQAHVLAAGTHTFTMATPFTNTPANTDPFVIG